MTNILKYIYFIKTHKFNRNKKMNKCIFHFNIQKLIKKKIKYNLYINKNMIIHQKAHQGKIQIEQDNQ